MTQKVFFPKSIIDILFPAKVGEESLSNHVKDGFMQDFMKIIKTKMINMGKI